MGKPTLQRDCIVCGCSSDRAIFIAGYALCPTCEARIAGTSCGDPGYDEIVARIRQFWHGLAEAAAARE